MNRACCETPRLFNSGISGFDCIGDKYDGNGCTSINGNVKNIVDYTRAA